jgi:hypothetical protein
MQYIISNLWLFLAVTFFVVIGGAVLLVTTGYLSRIMDWLRPNGDKQIPVKVFCEDRQIRDRKLIVGRYVISDHQKHRSFYLVHKLLMSIYKKSGRSKATFLALTERSARPLDFHNRMSPEDWSQFPSARKVFIDTTADIRSDSAKEATHNFMAQSLTILTLSVAVIVVVMGIIIFFTSKGSGVA